MSDAQPPVGDGSVPDKVLEELLAAFANDPVPEGVIDLDDPSIDKLLGLTPQTATKPPTLLITPAADDDPDVWRRASTAVPAITVPEPSEPSDPTRAEAAGDKLATPTGVEQQAVGAPVKPRTPIKIGGDDLPDAIYLSEEGEERLRGTSGRATEASLSTERTTIFIGDDEIEGMSGGIPVVTGSPAMDPRLRARRIAVKRAMGRKRLKWFVLIGAILLVVAGGLALLGSSLFAVQKDRIVVSGVHRIDSSVLSRVVGELQGTPVLLVDNRELERKLEASPWVKQARVTTHFPHGATIELVEREPIATYLGSDGRSRILAADGMVVDVIAGRPLEFMLITGNGPNVEAGSSSGQAFTHAAELVEALSATVRTRTGSVLVSDTGELSLIFRRPTPDKPGATIILGGPTNLLDKLTRLEAFLQQNGADQCTLINVSTAEISQKC